MCRRSDLNKAIDEDSLPLLFPFDNSPWPPSFTSDLQTSSNTAISLMQSHTAPTCIPSNLQPGLAGVWTAMAGFCNILSTAAEFKGEKVTEETFLQNIVSIMYRLAHQRFERGSVDEAFRLGLIAFSSPIFLCWNKVELADPRFNSAYRDTLETLELSNTNVSPKERLWLVMVAALSMADEPGGVAWFRSRLRSSIESCDVFTWAGVREVLNSVLWIGLMFDSQAKELCDLALSGAKVEYRGNGSIPL